MLPFVGMGRDLDPAWFGLVDGSEDTEPRATQWPQPTDERPEPPPDVEATQPNFRLPAPAGPAPKAGLRTSPSQPLAGFGSVPPSEKSRLQEAAKSGATSDFFASLGPKEPMPVQKQGFFHEFRGVLWTVGVGLLVFVGTVLYSGRSNTPREATPPPMTPADTAQNHRNALVPPKKDEAGVPSHTPSTPTPGGETTPNSTVEPMMSIVTVPKGALVEINGTLYGRTPIIKPGPKGVDSLFVSIKLKGHRRWEGQVSRNKAGHFSIQATLQPHNPSLR